MPTETVDAFEASLYSLPATVERVPTSHCEAAILDALEPPAVGVPLPYDGIALNGLPLTLSPTPAELNAATTGVTPSPLAIADYGSIIVADHGDGTEAVSLFPVKHIAVLAASDVVASMADAITQLGAMTRNGLTSAIIATGPSATADMGELVNGVHGPSDVHIIIIEDQ